MNKHNAKVRVLKLTTFLGPQVLGVELIILVGSHGLSSLVWTRSLFALSTLLCSCLFTVLGGING